MKVPDSLTRALVERDCSSDLCALLAAVENYERADWDTVQQIADRLNLSTPAIVDAYVEALHWARELQI
jgi:c-di-GMP-related signal transduction protein